MTVILKSDISKRPRMISRHVHKAIQVLEKIPVIAWIPNYHRAAFVIEIKQQDDPASPSGTGPGEESIIFHDEIRVAIENDLLQKRVRPPVGVRCPAGGIGRDGGVAAMTGKPASPWTGLSVVVGI